MSGAGVETGGYGDLLVTALIVLIAACVAMVVIVRLAGRWSAGRSARPGLLDVVARVPLESRRSLYIVDVAGKALLVGTSELGLTVLSELDRERVRAVPPAVSFAELVRGALQRATTRRRDDPSSPGDGGGGSGGGETP